MASINERGQILIIFSLIVAVILASISVLHAQNILAGMQTSRTLMVFPKDEIRNLKTIAEEGLMQFCGLSVDQFYERADNVSKQVRRLYSQRGVYGDVVAYFATPSGGVECYNVKLVYISGEVKYEENLQCCEGRGCV